MITKYKCSRSLWEEALEFAAVAHDKMYRKGTLKPYIVHPIEVSFIVAQMTDDQEIIAAAALHDVVEDTLYTISDIRNRFGERVAELVDSESEDKKRNQNPADTWKERKLESIEKLCNETYDVKLIALADKLSNLRSTMSEYEKIGDKVFERFNQKEKKEHEWYHRSILNILREFREYNSWKEYEMLCNKIFQEN